MVSATRGGRRQVGAAPEQSGWLRDFATVMSLTYALLKRGPLAEFKGRFEAWDQEYMPGAPPMSPVLDSFFMSWQACDVDLGEGETFASIAADLAPLLGLQKLQSRMRTLAGSHRGVFVVRGEREGLVELEEIDVCLKVRDILRRRRLWISERAATRGVSPGHLVAG